MKTLISLYFKYFHSHVKLYKASGGEPVWNRRHPGGPPPLHCFQRGLAVVRDAKARADTSAGLSQWVSAVRGPARVTAEVRADAHRAGKNVARWAREPVENSSPASSPSTLAPWLPGNPAWGKHWGLWKFPNLLPVERRRVFENLVKVWLWPPSGFE